MSVSYYIVDPLKKKTYEEFEKYWETDIYPGFKEKFEKFRSDNAKVLDAQLLDHIANLPRGILPFLCPVDSRRCEERFGFTSNADGKFGVSAFCGGI
ncbi:MAG: hypothetical protein IJI14_01545 [Anaerolineaceae bacterium]|nr:hypothetical protein [Anaerolineaceae bacterium]